MSIGKRILAAINEIQRGDPEAAFFQVCTALEDTARREYGSSGKQSFKKFVAANCELITRIGWGGGGIQRLDLGFSHPQIKAGGDGSCAIEDIVYHAIRCGLYHEAKLPPNLTFGPAGKISVGPAGELILPQPFVMGVVVSVILSPVNAGESMSEERYLNFGGVSLPFSKLWGRRAEVTWLIEVLTTQQQAAQQSPTVGEAGKATV